MADTLSDAFLEELRDAYDAEPQIIKTLPRLAKAATSPGAGTVGATRRQGVGR